MIYGLLNQGSGVGNQLHRYIALRIKADQLNTDWRLIWNPDGSGKEEGFKCKSFMDFDESKVIYDSLSPEVVSLSKKEDWIEKKVVENGVDIRSYDPEFNFIENHTIIEGEFQDERYWQDYEREVNEWLKVEPLEMPDDLCVIGFRGGEFKVFPDLFLPKEYFAEGIRRMKEINPSMQFEIHTDDIDTARLFFNEIAPNYNFNIIHDIGINWRSMRYAKYAIIANSSFFILPRWLKQHESNGSVTIAPKFWARYNTHTWALPQNYYKCFSYIHHEESKM